MASREQRKWNSANRASVLAESSSAMAQVAVLLKSQWQILAVMAQRQPQTWGDSDGNGAANCRTMPR
jgi:hypothetical protein